ncbi:MAG: M6 family metalloprotease domain-containing protein [Verrucomicrobiota bacterium]
MKKSKTFRPVQLFLLLAGCIGLANAAPYGPNGRDTQWTQPDGQVLELRVFGDDSYGRTETTDGYSLVFENNTYFYGQLSADGKTLVSTGVLATQPVPAGIAKHLELPKAEIARIAKSNRLLLDDGSDQRWTKRVQANRMIRGTSEGVSFAKSAVDSAKIDAAPVIGNKRGLTILIEFPNDSATTAADPIPFPTDQSKIVRFSNQVGYSENGNTGSVRDFFFDQSLGRLVYTQTVTPIVRLPRPRNFYNYSDYPANQNLQNPRTGASAMVSDAITILKAQNFDFTSLSVDESGNAIATNVFFAGEDSGSFAQGLWPHASTLAQTLSVGTPAKPVTLARYQITNIPDAAPVIGTFCHENGHLLLGFPDIYDVVGEGVGEHCLMGSGNYLNDGKTPSPINAYFKDLVGWANVIAISPNAFRTANLPTTGNVAYRLSNSSSPTEFFMVENRGAGDKWAQFSDDKGIAIWHIDETINGNLSGADHYGVAIMQSDGREDLENGRNRGDDTDLFDLITPKFTDATNPSARWWDNSRSAVEIEVLSDVGKSTTVSFGGVPPNTIIVSSPNGGEVLFQESIFPITWQANIVGNVRIDLFKGGRFLSTLTQDTGNTGTYTWEVSPNLKNGSDYSIRISSVGNAVAVADNSDATFSISNATFPKDNEIPYGWFKPKGAKSTWKVSKDEQFEGKASLVSSKPQDGSVGAIAYRSDFQAGTLGFYIKTSTEKGFDFARFYIDGVAQSFAGVASARGISGEVKWTFVQFPIAAGKHTFMWTYEKDDSYGGLQDAVWIDGVTMPTGTQEIAVQQPAGTNLVASKSERSFPKTATGDTSKPLTFTIKNRGKADLVDVRIITVGAAANEYVISGPGKKNLKKGETTTFNVAFRPKGFGDRKAKVRVISNDGDEGKFDIHVTGVGLGYPKMTVKQPDDSTLKSGDSRDFGAAKVKTQGKTRKFTVTNTGSAVLKNLRVDVEGQNPADFAVGALGVITLDPGDSTVFKVTFNPRAQDIRKAKLIVRSNDQRTGKFIIKVSGKGAPKGGKKGNNAIAAASGSIAAAWLGEESAQTAASTGVDVINGTKYLTLTVDKTQGVFADNVQVSSDLVEWFSGGKHTSVLVDDAKILKVRDNTPVTGDSKRYIRLK